jgi:hypothetical protein
LDTLISELHNIQIIATASGQTAYAKRAKNAIDLAKSYRSDFVYIRPSSDFLKNSYPSTSLQQNSMLWENMLQRHALRSMPWPLNDWTQNGIYFKNKKSDLITQGEIDKQFWQNINRVRVAGAGITSYAITKDDIGNWYVKSYTGNPEPIINGVKDTISYVENPAAKAATDLLSSKKASQETIVDQSFMDKQFTKFTVYYFEQTLRDATNTYFFATNWLVQLQKVDALKKDNNFLPFFANYTNIHMSDPISTLYNAIDIPNQGQELAKATVDVLNQLQKLNKTLTVKYYTNLPTEGKEFMKCNQLMLTNLIQTRLEHVMDYEAKLKLLGQYYQ